MVYILETIGADTIYMATALSNSTSNIALEDIKTLQV
jgi:hypothetical protein